MKKHCKKCGIELTWTGKQKRRKYCSYICSNSHHNFVSMGEKGGNAFHSKKGGRKGTRDKNEIERLRQIGKIGGVNSSKNQQKRSKGEIYLSMELKKIGFDVLDNQWNIVNGYEIDIFLPKENIAISYNGEVHRKPIYGQKRLNQIINRDTYRNRKLKEMGIHHIIIEDEGRFNKEKSNKQFKWCIEEIKKASHWEAL